MYWLMDVRLTVLFLPLQHHNEVRSVLAACNPSRAGALQRASLPASEAPTPRSLFSPELLASQYNRALLSLHGRVSEFLQKPPEKEEQAQQA